MAAKTEAQESAPPAAEKAGLPVVSAKKEVEAPSGVSAAGSKARGGAIGAWIPALVAIVLAPAASWAVAQYVMLPMLQKKLAQPVTPAEIAAAPAPQLKNGKAAPGATPPTYEFNNIVVNLAGTMGTRYLKTTFIVTGADDTLKGIFDDNKARLTDVTLNVLSSLTLSDLEEPGSKNVLREKLVSAYNQALGRKVADQVYFSDFVVQ